MKIKEKIKNSDNSIERIVLEGIAAVIVIIAVALSIRMNMEGHSLWWDEAALADSFTNRSLLTLTSGALDNVQSAPVGWLYFVKILTLILGNNDFVLRIPAILEFVGTLILVYLILKRTFRVYYPMLGTAFVATLPIILQYSNIFKPYIADCFFTLLTVWVYYCFKDKKHGFIKMGVIWAILLWFSNPVCFMAGGIIASDFIFSVIRKNKDRAIQGVLGGVILVASFVGDYFYWLRQTATDDSMLDFWKDWNLPLIPTSMADILQYAKCAGTIFQQFYRLEYVIMILVAVCAAYALVKKDELYLGIYGGFVVTVLASGLGMFPVNKRLWLFVYPLIVIVVAVGLDQLIKDTEVRSKPRAILGLAVLLAVLLNGGIRYYINTDHIYWPRYEVKAGYNYICENIEEDESVYVCNYQKTIFNYYNNYKQDELDGVGNPVYICQKHSKKYDYEEDLDFIISSGKCYIMAGDGWEDEEYMGRLKEGLAEAGYLQEVYNPYETPIYYFCVDEKDMK